MLERIEQLQIDYIDLYRVLASMYDLPDSSYTRSQYVHGSRRRLWALEEIDYQLTILPSLEWMYSMRTNVYGILNTMPAAEAKPKVHAMLCHFLEKDIPKIYADAHRLAPRDAQRVPRDADSRRPRIPDPPRSAGWDVVRLAFLR